MICIGTQKGSEIDGPWSKLVHLMRATAVVLRQVGYALKDENIIWA